MLWGIGSHRFPHRVCDLTFQFCIVGRFETEDLLGHFVVSQVPSPALLPQVLRGMEPEVTIELLPIGPMAPLQPVVVLRGPRAYELMPAPVRLEEGLEDVRIIAPVP